MDTDEKPTTYSQDEIQQILHLAIARQSSDDEFTSQQLTEIASELGIGTDTVRLAERDWLVQQREQQRRQEFNRHRRANLRRRSGKLAILNGFLVALDGLTSGGLGWSLYVLLVCGLVVALEAWKTFQQDGEEYERQLQRWEHARQLRQSARLAWRRVQGFLQCS